MKKQNRKSLVKACDREMSLFVRERDRYCVLCGSKERLQAGHLMSRVAFSTRWSVDNIFCQCASCNLRHEHDPSRFTLWYIKKYDLPKYEELVSRYHQIKKYTDSDLRILLACIQEMRVNLKVNS